MKSKRKHIKGKEEIQKIIESSGIKYLLVNNKIFDELYGNEELKMSELDLITYIHLQIMMLNKITLSAKELAAWIGCSEKQIRVVINRLKEYKVPCNCLYSPYESKVALTDDGEERIVSLITEKNQVVYNPSTKSNQKVKHWYPNLIPDHKKGKDKPVPVNFFLVSLKDLNLFTQGQLSRTEFITYLFLLKTYAYGKKDKDQVWMRYSFIASKTRRKLPQTTQDHIEKLKSLNIDGAQLIRQMYPNNYQIQMESGHETSSKFIPDFNIKTMGELKLEKKEVSFFNKEDDILLEEVDLPF
ncbi:hypothetical protein [Bacillus velezensis]|uniref:hypothetical protein n=1 Tax=Bacillus velezensis TaxID=492670 RepID=UPI000DC5A255|nr:hypothetical protein [Bacillus velezensis]MED3511721.1 hypothetical protein [Bacillus velezensis]RAP15225.1 hypothetical protein HS9_00552 [Bacillus velezensis]